MSQEQSLRQLFDRITLHKPASWTDRNPMSKWDGISLDETGHKVIRIQVQHTPMEGELNHTIFNHLDEFLPDLKHFELHHHALSCSSCTNSEESAALTLNHLPHHLEIFRIPRFHTEAATGQSPLGGVFSVGALPRSLVKFDIAGCSFRTATGDDGVFCEALLQMEKLESLWLAANVNFRGEVFAEFLPKSLINFSVENSNFSGFLNLDELSRLSNLRQLFLNGNSGLQLVADPANCGFLYRLDSISKKKLAMVSVLLPSEYSLGETQAEVRGDVLVKIAEDNQVLLDAVFAEKRRADIAEEETKHMSAKFDAQLVALQAELARVHARVAVADSPRSASAGESSSGCGGKYAFLERPDLELDENTKQVLRDNGIGQVALRRLKEDQLCKLGISLGDRVTLLAEIQKNQSSSPQRLEM